MLVATLGNKMERKPPATVRRELRKEVGFACPVEGCSSPYLTYHHFDPAWAVREHHNSEGMIALCLQHHKEADVGTYTNEQLRDLKEKEASHNSVSGRFNWKRENTLIIAGSNYFIGSPTILEIGDRKLIWFQKDEDGFDTVNMDLYAKNGQLVFQMRDNDWVVTPSLDDVEAPPSGRSLKVRCKRNKISIDLDFSNSDIAEIRKRASKIAWNSTIDSVKQQNEHRPEFFPKVEFKEELEKRVVAVTGYVSKNFGMNEFMLCEVGLSIVHPISLKLSPLKLETKVSNTSLMLSGNMMGSATVLKL